MAVLGKADYCVLNAVALKKMASAGALADLTGLPPGQVEDRLSRLAGLGLVETVAGSALPSDDAEAALKQSAAEHYAALRADPAVLALADGFEDINVRLLAAMSAWQQVDIGGHKVANDHADSAYDDKIITRIDRLVQRLGPLLDALSQYDERFAGYRQRFTAALDAIDEGRPELVSSVTADSVHTIWFEFHEDLLRTLGRERKE
jgi:predicted transcriptional regulator